LKGGELMDNFGIRLKKLRKENGIRQKDLADVLGLAQTTIANYEQNSRFPNEEILKRISDYFNVSFDYLLGRTNIYQKNKPKILNNDIQENKLKILTELYNEYLEYLLQGKKNLATDIIIQSVKLGIDVHDVYMHIFEPSLKEIGGLWERGKITVADEHYFSLITQHIMSLLHPYMDIGNRKNYSVLALSAGGEHHTIGMRMVSDFFEMAGWDTYFLGSNAPTESIINTLSKYNIDLLAFSVTMNNHINSVENIIDAIHNANHFKSIKIIVGGSVFINDTTLWHRIGADGFAPNAIDAVILGTKLVEGKIK